MPWQGGRFLYVKPTPDLKAWSPRALSVGQICDLYVSYHLLVLELPDLAEETMGEVIPTPSPMSRAA